MKKLITALLLTAMLIQALPFEALATVGKVLSKEELARAYALTGLGTGGLKANSNGAYHAGMRPNLGWNASQLDDWLEEKLAKDLNSVEDHGYIALVLHHLRRDRSYGGRHGVLHLLLQEMEHHQWADLAQE